MEVDVLNKLKVDNIRIGILTFHYAINPGSALQAYGMWKTIDMFGKDIGCEIINYQNKHYRDLFFADTV